MNYDEFKAKAAKSDGARIKKAYDAWIMAVTEGFSAALGQSLRRLSYSEGWN